MANSETLASLRFSVITILMETCSGPPRSPWQRLVCWGWKTAPRSEHLRTALGPAATGLGEHRTRLHTHVRVCCHRAASLAPRKPRGSSPLLPQVFVRTLLAGEWRRSILRSPKPRNPSSLPTPFTAALPTALLFFSSTLLLSCDRLCEAGSTQQTGTR